jgi:hypothetical protein
MKVLNNIQLEAILDSLKAKFPNKLPTKTTTEVELARLQGQQDVITIVTALLEKDKGK